MDIDELRIELAKQGKWNIGFFCSGLFFWLLVLVIYQVQPASSAKVFVLVGTFLIFPVALAFSSLFKADPFCKNNALGNLVGYTHLSVITLSFPIILLLFSRSPEYLLFGMAIIYCLDFFFMSWAFGHIFFSAVASFRVLAVSVSILAAKEYGHIVIPLIAVSSYVLIIVFILLLRRRWLSRALQAI
jgi:small-conductance mechanosensitive channel